MMRGMIDWAGLAQRKYDIMQQGANADTSRAGTARMQAETQASLAPSAIAGAEADAAVARARAAGMPALIDSEIGLNTANAGLIGANTVGQRINNDAMRTVFTPESIAAMARWMGVPSLDEGLLTSPMFQRTQSTKKPLSTINTETPAQTGTTRRSGGFSVTEDENGIRTRRGLGMF